MEASRYAIQLPDDQDIALLQTIKRRMQLRPRTDPRTRIREQAMNPSTIKSIALH